MGAVLGYDMKSTFDLDGLEYVRVLDLHDFVARLEREDSSSTAFVIQITREMQSFPIYRLLSRLDKKTVIFARGYLPSLSHSERSLAYYLRLLFDPHAIKRLVYFRLYAVITKLLPLIKKYDVAFVAGTLAERIHSTDSVRLARVHHSDIDFAAMDVPCSVALPNRYCVFIDDYLPFHPDLEISGYAAVKAASYYASLNRYFDAIERACGATVVIAAHPRARYAENPFGGRLIVTNQTNALVKNAAIAVAHASSAVSFVVIHGKPLCLIYSEEIKALHPAMYNQMLKTAAVLGCPVMSFETDTTAALATSIVDQTKYAEYFAEFLSSGVGGSTSFQVAVAEIDRLLGVEQDGSAVGAPRSTNGERSGATR